MVNEPQNEGLLGQTRRLGAVRIEKFEMTFGEAEGLHCFTDEVQFFTPALLYMYGRFTDEPLAQFMNEQDGALQVMHHRFEKPIFQGFEAPMTGNKDWNHVLWGVIKEKYQALENYLLSVTFTASAESWLSRIGAQDATILDPLAVDQAAIVSLNAPRIPIIVWGVDSSLACLAVEMSPGAVFEMPKLKRHPPQPETVAEAKAYFAGQNPLRAREESLQEQKEFENESGP